ncbi:hypothetical protein LSTR_LSTR010214 [Laodelphax striatellus]|uniref:Uncharacterized protein n=1 Tax=Laodelphax striatellus TaxID=195883 RepID=A0A482WPT6_LAOST|nr:hypothetical protein LSTR_LSTR010214 [Laodelphax striatellus]
MGENVTKVPIEEVQNLGESVTEALKITQQGPETERDLYNYKSVLDLKYFGKYAQFLSHHIS